MEKLLFAWLFLLYRIAKIAATVGKKHTRQVNGKKHADSWIRSNSHHRIQIPKAVEQKAMKWIERKTIELPQVPFKWERIHRNSVRELCIANFCPSYKIHLNCSSPATFSNWFKKNSLHNLLKLAFIFLDSWTRAFPSHKNAKFKINICSIGKKELQIHHVDVYHIERWNISNNGRVLLTWKHW